VFLFLIGSSKTISLNQNQSKYMILLFNNFVIRYALIFGDRIFSFFNKL